MFDNTLGNYTRTKYKIKLLKRVQPYHDKPFPIPEVHETENVDRLENKNALKLKCKKNSE